MRASEPKLVCGTGIARWRAVGAPRRNPPMPVPLEIAIAAFVAQCGEAGRIARQQARGWAAAATIDLGQQTGSEGELVGLAWKRARLQHALVEQSRGIVV